MASTRINFPQQIFIGSDSTQSLISDIRSEFDRVLMITEPGFREEQSCQQFVQAFEKERLNLIFWDEFVNEPTVQDAQALAELMAASRAPVAIALGGARILNLSRTALAIYRARLGGNKRPNWYYEVPTTPKYSFLLADSVLLHDENLGAPNWQGAPSSMIRAQYWDPTMMGTLTQKSFIAALTTMVLVQAEGLVCHPSYSLASQHFIASAGAIGPILESNDPIATENFERAIHANVSTAIAQSQTPYGIGILAPWLLSKGTGLPKAWLSAIVAPHVIEWLLGRYPEVLAPLSRALGEDSWGIPERDAASKVLDWFRRTMHQHGIPSRLKEAGVEMGQLKGIEEQLGRLWRSAPTQPPYEEFDVATILKKAY